MFTDGGMYTHAIAILEIDLGSQTGRNTIQTHSYVDHLTSRVEVCKLYFPVYTLALHAIYSIHVLNCCRGSLYLNIDVS
jgi:hypothetical protein